MKVDFSRLDMGKRMETLKGKSLEALKTLTEGTGPGNDFLGWVDQPVEYDKEEFSRILKAGEKIREQSDILVVIGIGGSYLGTKAVDYALSPYFPSKDNSLQLVYAGHHISSTYMNELIEFLKDKEYSINVVSKSGTTTEPSIAFRFLKEEIEKKYGEGAKERIYATTDKEKGALKGLSDEMGYETFVVPDDIGGRYSVLSAVGLLPLAAAGYDIEALMEGARAARERYKEPSFEKNDALKYATARNILYKDGKVIEILANYEPALKYVAEWWKQLFAESEGKENKGIFPISTNFTTDLHSVGQMIQEGERNLFETVLEVETPRKDLKIPHDESDLDGLNYLSGKNMSYVNKMAMEGTTNAHLEGDVPNIRIILEKIDEKELGELIYFFEISCAVSGYMLGINPFNQPGVEAYKTQMFKLLEKPGY